MDLLRIIDDLKKEREKVITAIVSIEKLVQGDAQAAPKRRGRPKGSKNKPKASEDE